MKVPKQGGRVILTVKDEDKGEISGHRPRAWTRWA